MKPPVPDHIASLAAYPPGKPIEELEREYGITGSIKLASNENPLGPSPLAVAAIRNALSGVNRYPDSHAHYLRRRLCEKFELDPRTIVFGNGSDEILELITRTLCSPGSQAVMPDPSFLCYRLTVESMGAEPVAVALDDFRIDLDALGRAVTDRTRLVFLTNPNNPTGNVVSRADFESFLERVPPAVTVVVDEAYIEFVRDESTLDGFEYIGREGPTVLVLRTFSKAYGLAGLRIGYGVTHPVLAEYLNRVRSPFNTSLLAQIGALAALDDDDFLERTRTTVWEGLDYLYAEMARLGLRYLPSQANFFLVETPVAGREIYEALLRQGVIVRPMESYGLKGFIRVNAGLPEENERFVAALETVLAQV